MHLSTRELHPRPGLAERDPPPRRNNDDGDEDGGGSGDPPISSISSILSTPSAFTSSPSSMLEPVRASAAFAFDSAIDLAWARS